MRVRRNRAGADYDSVLDTMTNVVGILVIVVTVTQLNVGSAVGRARERLIESGEVIDHPPVSDTALEAVRGQRAGDAERLKDLEERWAHAAPAHEQDTQDWTRIRDELAAASGPGSAREVRSSIRKLEEEIRRARSDIESLEERIGLASRASQALRKQLEALDRRRLQQPSRLRMRLPDPRSSRTEGLTGVQFIVKGGRVYECDVDSLRKQCLADLKNASDVPQFTPLLPGAAHRWLARFWNRKGYTDGIIRLKFEAHQAALTRSSLVCTVSVVPGAKGASLRALQQSQSEFHRQLRLHSPRKNWFLFRVYDDSFESYLTARTLAEDKGYPVGWVPYAPDEEVMFLFAGKSSGRRVEAD